MSNLFYRISSKREQCELKYLEKLHEDRIESEKDKTMD